MDTPLDKEALQEMEAGLGYLQRIISREAYVNDRMQFDINLPEKEYEFSIALAKNFDNTIEALSSARSTIRKYLKDTEEKDK